MSLAFSFCRERLRFGREVSILCRHSFGADMTVSFNPSIAESNHHARPNELPDLSVIIPALNEAENLRSLLPLIREVVADLDLAAEVIVVDGGSTDDTKSIVPTLGA